MISIIVPFNNEKYLERCLENLKNIKYKDFEIIMINDFCNTDISKFIEKYSNVLNIKYYKTCKNTIGVGNARNLGIEKASGNYIMFIDSDDSIDINLLNFLQPYIDKNVEMIKYNMNFRDDKILEIQEKNSTEKDTLKKITTGKEWFNKEYFKDKFLDSPCLYLIKKDLIDKLNLRFEVNVFHEDFGLIPQLRVNANTFVDTKYLGYNYFQTDNSIIRNNDYSKKIKKVDDKIFLYEKLLKNLEKYNLDARTFENILIYYINSIIFSIGKLNYKDRIFYENILKNKKVLKNLKCRNFKQYIKKLMLKYNMELYYKIKRRDYIVRK